MDLLDPTEDYVFKRLLGEASDEKRRIAMLTDVWQPRVPIVSATVLNPEIPPDVVKGKAIVLDLRLVLDDGRRNNVEMEAEPRAVYPSRNLYYWSKSHGNQLEAGEGYGNLRPTTSITWFGTSLPRATRGSAPAHARYRILEATTKEELCDHFDLHLLDVPRLVADESTRPELRRWARLFHDPSEETLRRLADEDEIMADTIEKLRALSADAETRRIAQLRRESEFFIRYEREIERAEGHAEGRRDTARRLLRAGVDRATILSATELSELELDALERDRDP